MGPTSKWKEWRGRQRGEGRKGRGEEKGKGREGENGREGKAFPLL